MDDHLGALVQLRAYLAQERLPANTRLPPERQLCDIIGASRGALRKALAVLEAEGSIWRHVGKGTFVGAPPGTEHYNLVEAAQRTNPAEVMRARIALEPILAGEAALNTRPADIEAMRDCLRRCRTAATWRQYEAGDNRLHKLIADGAHNEVLSAVYDVLAGIRRTVVWGRLRQDGPRPPADHHSFAEHEVIVTAIAERDRLAATSAMQRHLRSVERHLFLEVLSGDLAAATPRWRTMTDEEGATP